MGKEVKVTASEPLTADKEVRIGKTMGKSDEPTLIPIDEDLGGAKKKTVNKTAGKNNRKINVKSSDIVSKREAEKISDAADALVVDDVKPVKKSVKNTAKAPVRNAKAGVAKTGAKAGAKTLAMDGMTTTTRPKAATKAKVGSAAGKSSVGNVSAKKADSLSLDTKEFVDDKEYDDEAKVNGGVKHTKQPSKSKAAMIAIITAILVGAAGMVLLFFLNRRSDAMCVLQFESNGGSKIESQEVVCGTKASRPDDPEKEGFEFQDWLADGMPFNFEEDTVDKDMIVKAKWLVGANTEVVTITFDSAGGSEVTEREAIKGKPTTAPLDPTRDGYTFDGWYLDGEKFDFDTPIDEDITLVAGWKASDGTVTVPQGGNSDKNQEKHELTMFEIDDVNWTVGVPVDVLVRALPQVVAVDLAIVRNDNPRIECLVVADRKLQCSSVEAGEANVTVTDKKTGKSATFKVTFKAKESGGGSTTPPPTPPTQDPEPTTPECGEGEELVDNVCKTKCGEGEERGADGVCREKQSDPGDE